MFPESELTGKRCFLAMFLKGEQTRKHCFSNKNLKQNVSELSKIVCSWEANLVTNAFKTVDKLEDIEETVKIFNFIDNVSCSLCSHRTMKNLHSTPTVVVEFSEYLFFNQSICTGLFLILN